MILIKQHNSHQVAHFYEHLFCMELDDFFYGYNLFPYLDYAIVGRTLHGVIYIRIELYTKKAKQLAEKLASLTIVIDDHAFNVTLTQLGSELEQKLGMIEQGNNGQKILYEELYALDKKPWKNIDEIDVIDPRKSKLVVGALSILKDKKEIPTKKIEISFALGQSFAEDHKELLPLFVNTARLMSANVSAILHGQLGYCPTEISHTPEHLANNITESFRVIESHGATVKDVLEMTQDALIDLNKEKAFTRLASELSQATASNPEHLFPDPYTTYKRTDIIIGAKGWQRIATDENCKLLLSHMKVTITTGQEKVSVDIKSIYKV